MRDETDLPLVEGLRRGEPRALEAAYHKYRARTFGFLLRLCRRRDVAEELLQDTWLKLARNGTRLAEDTDLAAWLFTVARNAWVSHRRWSMLDLSRLVAMGDEPEWIASEAASPDELTEQRRAMLRLERALLRLADGDREVLLLVAVEGFEQEEAARILGIRYDTFRQRLARARARLEARLEKTHD
ncbi:MAG: RNA polymerase sigma factor [Myxococcales bacterium]|nr:RNA polymerase sigma factor [Myxococcales bacterium]